MNFNRRVVFDGREIEMTPKRQPRDKTPNLEKITPDLGKGNT